MTQMVSIVPFEVLGKNDRIITSKTIALLSPGLIETECDLTFFCLIRNISPTGMMASVYAPVVAEQLIRLRLSETAELYGEIVWCEDDRIGVKFETEIDVASVLSELAANSPEKGKYRVPCIPV